MTRSAEDSEALIEFQRAGAELTNAEDAVCAAVTRTELAKRRFDRAAEKARHLFPL